MVILFVSWEDKYIRNHLKTKGKTTMTIEKLVEEYQTDREQIEQVLADGFTLEEIEEMLIESEL